MEAAASFKPPSSSSFFLPFWPLGFQIKRQKRGFLLSPFPPSPPFFESLARATFAASMISPSPLKTAGRSSQTLLHALFSSQVDFYSNRFLGTNLNNPSFAEVARSMGAEGERVTAAGDVGPALERLLASGRPGVLEVCVTRALADPFRRDALSVPVRHLEKYKKFT